jgi:hypothetical protein
VSPQAKKVYEEIRRLLDSDRVPLGDYKELLEEVASDCECRLDCLREEEAAGDE